MDILAVIIIIIAIIIAFFLKGRISEKILAVVYAVAGLAVAYIPMGWGWQIFFGFVVVGSILASMNDGSINIKKTSSQAIGLLMVMFVPARIVFIDWLDWNIGWLLLILTLYWCYEYINAVRK